MFWMANGGYDALETVITIEANAQAEGRGALQRFSIRARRVDRVVDFPLHTPGGPS
jgi:hypothetical protein